MLDFLALAVAVVALIIAASTNGKLRELRTRLAEFEPLRRDLRPRADEVVQIVPAAAAATMPSTPPEAASAAPPPLPDAAPVAATEAMAPEQPSGVTSEPSPPVPPALPAPAPGMEERIGTRWVVWVGGLTLALGGLFLVKYSIDQGLLGPRTRVTLGGLFALVLLGLGEFSRRREALAQIAPLALANIPAILTAAGTIVAFGTVYVAYALYDFLPPGAAFILLGVVALGALAAALLHGPVLAGLGVAGAFIAPLLVSTAKPDYWALYIYLAVVTAASFGLSRIRLWRWLAVTTIVLSTLWAFPCLDCGPAALGPHAFHAIAGFALASLLVVCGFMFGPSIEPGRIEPISSASIAVYGLVTALLVVLQGHSDSSLTVFTIITAATLVVAWRAEAATGAVAASAAFVALVFLSWLVQSAPDTLGLQGGPLPGIGIRATDASVNAHLITAVIFGIGFAAAGFLAQGRFSHAIAPVIWSACGVAVPIALLIALYARIAHLDRSIPFALVAVVVAGLFAAATEQLTKREQRTGQVPGQVIATALFASGTLAALALALTFALEKGWLTVAIALMSLGTAWISLQRPVPFLRSLAAILAGIVVARIGYEPRIVGSDVGATPIFNWVLLGYGVPAASFWGGAFLMRKRADDVPLRAVESAAILFTVLLAVMEIRHFINGGDVYAATAGLSEVALDVGALLALAIGLERLRLRSHSVIHNIGAMVITAIAAFMIVVGLLIVEMPMITSVDIGGPFFNLILLGYALPAILMLLLSYAVAGHRPGAYANTIAGGALVLALFYVTLQARRFFHGEDFSYGGTSDAEQYTYSLTWLVFGVALLVIGFAVKSERARIAAAVVIGLTVLKAFAVDVWTLEVVYRALSFIGLGAVLVAIGWFYQRVMYRRGAETPAQVSTPVNQ
jgi:uncharacterized membrane protein